MKLLKRLKKYLNPEEFDENLEHLMAVFVLIGLMIAVIALKDSIMELWLHRAGHGAFLEFIDSIFQLVIGIEFFKLLWKPKKSNLIEVLMFVLARHMIIESADALQKLFMVLSIMILFLTDKYLLCENTNDED